MTATTLDPQQAAAASDRQNLLVVAPPGCGKTELLALRAKELIPRLKPHQRILALTFTNKAKQNLNERLRHVLGMERLRRYVSVRNFHGHATEILLAHGSTIGLCMADLKLPEKDTVKRALARFSSDRDTRFAAEDRLNDVKRAPLTDDEVLRALDGAGDELARAVELDRVESSQLHYSDLLRHAQRLLGIRPVANLYQQHFGAMLVDEFQDLSLQQLEIALLSCSAWRTFVGDPLQGIYSFAGSAPVQVEQQLLTLCGEPVQLTTSYRSSPAVLGMVNSIAVTMGAAPLRSSETMPWPGGGISLAGVTSSFTQEAATIVKLAGMVLDKTPDVSIGVIARSGWRRKEIDQAFSLTDIPCRRWDLAIDDPAILNLIRRSVSAMPKEVSIDDARDWIISRIDPADVETMDQVMQAFEQIAEGGFNEVHAAVRQFRVAADDEDVVGAGVHLLNAHTGKGQQFDWVIVCGLEDGHVPDFRAKTDAEVAEEKRVLLVMLSRARLGLIVTRSTSRPTRYGPMAQKPSPWWDQLHSVATADDLSAFERFVDALPK